LTTSDGVVFHRFTVTFSYAFWTISVNQNKQNVVTLGCLSFTLNDIDTNGYSTNISLTNAYPISDNKGINTKPYIFTITNTCSIDGKFNIYLHKLESSSLSSKYIKVYLTDKNNNSLVSPKLVNNLLSVNDNIANDTIISSYGTVNETFELYTFDIKENESVSYNLRMWIDFDAPNSIMGQTYNSVISVTAVPLK